MRNVANWFTPGVCKPGCDASEKADSEHGWGIAGVPIEILPKRRTKFSKAALEVGALRPTVFAMQISR
jgi:hypothetical protein